MNIFIIFTLALPPSITIFEENLLIFKKNMKRSTVLIISLFLLSFSLFAQEQKTVTVKAGTRIKDYFTHSDMYRYPEFIQGKVSFRDGNSTVVKLNYCILSGEMQFVASGDTMEITNEKNIRIVQIMQDTFYCDNGFLEVLAGYGPVIMAVKQFVKLSDIKKEGPYGTRPSGSSATTYSGIYDEGSLRNYNLIQQQDFVLSKKSEYFIGNEKDGFFPYKKNNVLKIFPQRKSVIDDFLNKNMINFKAKDDLVRLTQFLLEIQ